VHQVKGISFAADKSHDRNLTPELSICSVFYFHYSVNRPISNSETGCAQSVTLN
jgi:hypothetical protein